MNRHLLCTHSSKAEQGRHTPTPQLFSVQHLIAGSPQSASTRHLRVMEEQSMSSGSGQQHSSSCSIYDVGTQ